MDPIQLTRELVAIESTTGREQAATAHLAGVLERAGWRVERQPVADGRENIYAWREPPVVVFSTHLDCVPPFLTPREDDEYLYGRGTCDAKGLAAAMVSAAEQLAGEGEKRIGLLFVVGEENGSDGAKLAEKLEPKGSYMINGEPTDSMLTIGQKGVLRITISATGKEAHSAYPEEGRSAIVPLLETLRKIRRMPLPFDPTLGSATLNVGTIAGGVAPNVIPGSARAELLIRTVSNVSQLKAAIMATAEPGVEITFPLEIPHVQSPTIPGWRSTIVNFASDLPFFGAWGVGYQLGPGSIRDAHTVDEKIRKADLIAGAAQYAALARDLIARESA